MSQGGGETKAHEHSYETRITVNPDILVGKPVIKGTRIPVYLILNLIAHNYDFDRIIEDYPSLTHQDVKAALLYASEVLEKRPTKHESASNLNTVGD